MKSSEPTFWSQAAKFRLTHCLDTGSCLWLWNHRWQCCTCEGRSIYPRVWRFL